MTTEGDEQVSAVGEMDAGRVLALSDGVFAIAATLLVLELRLPEGVEAAELPHRLHELLPEFGGYALSYVLIGLLWLGHHRLFRNFTQISVRVARLNLLFLGSVSVLPFVTSLLRYDAPIAAQAYAGLITVIFLLDVAMAVVAGHRGHVADQAAGRMSVERALLAAAVFAVSIPIAQIPTYGPDLAKYSWILLVPVRLVHRLVR